MHRFFVEGVRAAGDAVALAPADARKATVVLRLREGDALEVIDSASHAFRAHVRLDGGDVVAVLDDLLEARAPQALRVDVAQAVPKAAKMDFIVEKLTELGVERILPFQSQRSIAAAPGTERLERWRRLAQTAAMQCGRRDVPAILASQPLASIVDVFAQYDAVLFAWELADRRPLREVLPAALSGAQRVLVAIGPEGGFTHDEAGAARDAGAHVVHLGPRILRTETAGLVFLAILTYAGANDDATRRPEIGSAAS